MLSIVLGVVSYALMSVTAVLIVLSATRKWGKTMDGKAWRFRINLLTLLTFAALVTRAALFPSHYNLFLTVIWAASGTMVLWALVGFIVRR